MERQQIKTQWVKLDLQQENLAAAYVKELRQAADFLRQGQLVAFPTETVYGLGGNALDPASVGKIYAAKGRPSDNPLIVHVATKAQVAELAEVSPLAEGLIHAFCPGPLTLVLPKKAIVPKEVTGGLDTVAIRIPNHPVAMALLQQAGLPIAAPSANLSGKPSPTTGAHVYRDLAGRIAMVLDSGSAGVGLESTVLDVTGDTPVILRPGAVTLEHIRPYAPGVLLGGSRVGAKEVPKAPGMKYKHYAPNGQVKLYSAGELPAACQQAMASHSLETLAVMATDRVLRQLPLEINRFSLGAGDLETVAQRMFAGLRWCDQQQASLILAESFPEEGLGCAIMNRLKKAAYQEPAPK